MLRIGRDMTGDMRLIIQKSQMNCHGNHHIHSKMVLEKQSSGIWIMKTG